MVIMTEGTAFTTNYLVEIRLELLKSEEYDVTGFGVAPDSDSIIKEGISSWKFI